MKQILGDNQFFGVNHADLSKGFATRNLFESDEDIFSFVDSACKIGMHGFMMNSNERGYSFISNFSFSNNIEIHYSIPYPHKYASITNEEGLLGALLFVISKATLRSLCVDFSRFILSRNMRFLTSILLDLEVPKKLPKGSHIYLQNVVTDLLVGIGRSDIIFEFINKVLDRGYYPGLITLNPILLDDFISRLSPEVQKSIILCYNINVTGFNVFPSKSDVESFSFQRSNYKKMGMSILSSGGGTDIREALDYISKIPLDYVVYGTSKIDNLEANLNYLNSRII